MNKPENLPRDFDWDIFYAAYRGVFNEDPVVEVDQDNQEVIIDNTISIYCDDLETAWEVSDIVVIHNYPHEPDDCDNVNPKIHENFFGVIGDVIQRIAQYKLEYVLGRINDQAYEKQLEEDERLFKEQKNERLSDLVRFVDYETSYYLEQETHAAREDVLIQKEQ